MIDRCMLSDEELIKKANEWVSSLAKTGGKSWSLRVPVDFNNDPDMIFNELASRYEYALDFIRINIGSEE